MAFLQLNNSSLQAEIDDEDLEKCSKYSWSLLPRGYVYTSESVYRGKSRYRYKTVTIYLHKLIKPDYYQVDHIDRNPLNNKKENLREATSSQNASNRPKYLTNASSRYKGVCRIPRRNCWQSRIKVHKKQIYLGSFRTEEEAALAYNVAAVKYFGEFACLNIL